MADYPLVHYSALFLCFFSAFHSGNVYFFRLHFVHVALFPFLCCTFLCSIALFFLLVLFHIFFLFARPFDQKLGSSLIYFFYLYTTIRPKIRVLNNLFLLFVHDHSTKRDHSYTLIYSVLNCANISFAIFMAILSLYFVRYIHGYMQSLPLHSFHLLLYFMLHFSTLQCFCFAFFACCNLSWCTLFILHYFQRC